jgi:regulator of protease activity HflC (stomatin/prohibitin superfamily)
MILPVAGSSEWPAFFRYGIHQLFNQFHTATAGNHMSSGIIVVLVIALVMVVALIKAVKIVPQSEAWLIEKIGKYERTLGPGLQVLVPFLETVRFRVSVLETQLPPDPINAITHDNVSISVQLAILYRIVDPARAYYRIENLNLGIKTVINGTVRSVIGKTDLDAVQSNRRHLASEIETELQHVADEWGVKLTRVEVTEVEVDESTKEAMQIQLNAERKRRGVVTQAEGDRQAAQLQADARLYTAQKDAEAKKILADAEAYSVTVVAKAISDGGVAAVDFEIRKLQAAAVQSLGSSESSKIVLLPSDALTALTGMAGKFIGQ